MQRGFGALGFGFNIGGRRGGGGTPTPTPAAKRNAIRLLAPGHATGTGAGTSSGSPVYAQSTYVNDSGAPITVASPVFIGWYLTTAGTSNIGNDVPVTGRIEYPSGTTVATFASSGSPTITIPNGGQVEGDQITLSAPIPAGASFDIILSCTIAAGQKYPNSGMLGLAGLNSATAAGVSRAKVCGFAIGDSIATYNGSVFYASAAGKFPLVQMSIAGAQAQTYGQSGAAQFAKQTALMGLLGVTDLFSNFGTNDIAAGTSLANIQSYLSAIKTSAASAGAKMRQCTILPRISTGATTANATGATGSGNTITITLDTSPYPFVGLFTVGYPCSIAGASQAGYNGSRFCTGVNYGANTVTFLTDVANPAANGGGITITAYNGINSLQPNFQYAPPPFEAGSGSMRGQVNAWIRGGAFDGFIDWADAAEPSRDSGRWLTAGETSALLAISNGTVSARVNDARFTSTGSAVVGNQAVLGLLQWTSGPNIGQSYSVSSSNGGDITLSSPANSIAAGQTFRVSGVASYATAADDGIHPTVSVDGKGGQELIRVPTDAYFTALAA